MKIIRTKVAVRGVLLCAFGYTICLLYFNTMDFTEAGIDTLGHEKQYKTKKSACKFLSNSSDGMGIRVVWGSENYIEMTKNCQSFIKNRHYISHPLSDEEAEYPIAYSIVAYTDIDRVERLLRAIYQPQNVYCIHVDTKAGHTYVKAMLAIASCLDNVFIASKLESVKWGTMSVLQADLNCMAELWRFSRWKYYINLTGQEFPLKTNWEIVQILKTYNGANDVDSTSKSYKHGVLAERFINVTTPIPTYYTLSKGSVHIVVQRGFVDFVLHNKYAHTLLQWLNTTRFPDETFFNTLNNSPFLGIPGSFTGRPVRNRNKPHIARYKIWEYYAEEYFDWYPKGGFPKCQGKFVRHICIFGVGDLPHLMSSKAMFANKFHRNFQSEAYDCLEKHHFEKLLREQKGYRSFDTNYYSSLDFVKYHLK